MSIGWMRGWQAMVCLGLMLAPVAVRAQPVRPGAPGAAAPPAAEGGRDALYRKLEVLAEVLGQIDAHYVDPVNAVEVAYGAARGALASLDAHSTFYSPDEYKVLLDATEGEYAGLGLEVELKGNPEIVTVYPDTPAARAGLKPNDIMVKVDGQDVTDMDYDGIERLMRGPVDSQVVLEVRRGAAGEMHKVTLTRGWVRVAPLSYRPLLGGALYVQIKTFSRRVATDLETLLNKKSPKGGLILDLRGNPGGLFDEAVAVCDLFLEEGDIVSVVGRGDQILEQQKAHAHNTQPQYKMAVLIDGNSASAAEIVAGALRDRGRARLFGQKSFGKGSVQSILDLTDGSGLKLTVARYRTPSGKQIDGHGVEPHETVAEPQGGAVAGTDAVLQVAQHYLGTP